MRGARADRARASLGAAIDDALPRWAGSRNGSPPFVTSGDTAPCPAPIGGGQGYACRTSRWGRLTPGAGWLVGRLATSTLTRRPRSGREARRGRRKELRGRNQGQGLRARGYERWRQSIGNASTGRAGRRRATIPARPLRRRDGNGRACIGQPGDPKAVVGGHRAAVTGFELQIRATVDGHRRHGGPAIHFRRGRVDAVLRARARAVESKLAQALVERAQLDRVAPGREQSPRRRGAEGEE